jgi:predicted transcriptional regulator of viral defense system
MSRQLALINTFVADGRDEFTFEEARARLGTSPTAAANVLHSLLEKGLIDRVARGRYAIRPLGSLGTSAATRDLCLAVGVALSGTKHRIAYRSALSEHGLLSHPVRTIFVAATRQVRISTIGRRPLHVVIERMKTIGLEADRVGHSWLSTPERALFECALRVDLAGGIEQLAEALSQAESAIDVGRIKRVVKAFGSRGLAAERRLATIGHTLGLSLPLNPKVSAKRPIIKLDPREERVEWVDHRFRVAWNLTAQELANAVNN